MYTIRELASMHRYYKTNLTQPRTLDGLKDKENALPFIQYWVDEIELTKDQPERVNLVTMGRYSNKYRTRKGANA